MKQRKMLLLAGAALLVAVGCSAEPKPKAEAKPVVNPEAHAFEVYKQNCAGCHGQGLEGVSGPALSGVGARMNADMIAMRINGGGRGMPQFKGKLEEAQINELVQWLGEQK